MEFIIENWYIFVAMGALIWALIYFCLNFLKRPTKEQIRALKEWLLYAVTVAEKDLGGGTGRLKLRRVYDMFLIKFPWLARIISFEEFSLYVDEALGNMKTMLQSNDKAAAYVYDDKSEEGTVTGITR